MSDAIFVIGYYRSGTSALSGALQRAGVKFYNEADPNEHNPLGFYEIPELIEFDVELFQRLGVDWTDVRGLPRGWAERADLAALLGRLEGILRQRFSAQDRVWGLKHPHLCRTLPLYERAARQAGHAPRVVHIFRDPWTAASSQSRKNGLSRAHALLLWMSYATDAEQQARHIPRSWVTYQELLIRPAVQLQRIEADLGLPLAALSGDGLQAASAYLTSQLNRSEPLPQEDLCRPLRALVTRTWEAIEKRNFLPALWDGFAEETADLVNFLAEIGASRGRVIPALGGSLGVAGGAAPAGAPMLRPPERTDEGGKARLELLRARLEAQLPGGALPRLAVVIAAPRGRAQAVNETLESLRGQWAPPALIKVVAVEALHLEGVAVLAAPPEPEAITRLVCAELNLCAAAADYVAVINAGDTITADGCLRFAMLAAQTGARLLYSDEVVPREGGAWIRHKPGWDLTRLRQAAYIGDWVWYGGAAVLQAGGFDPERAGAEEYDMQLRLAQLGVAVARLPEAVFVRAAQSRRDDIEAASFCARALAGLKAHLEASGLPAEVQNRQHPGLFHHMRLSEDPGTSFIMLCDGAEIPALDKWLTGLLSGRRLSGPVILAGAGLSAPMTNYFNAVIEKRELLGGQVLAVPPGGCPALVLEQALAMAATPHVAVLEARMLEVMPHWLEGLRMRLADPGVAAVAARTLVPPTGAGQQAQLQGPIIIGADTRLGAGHGPNDPGPGGWLLVDQEASAIAPPGLLARRAALAACRFPPHLAGDALWIDLCAQLRAAGHRLVWTPDVSFVMPPGSIVPDAELVFREGSPAAQALPWADPYHHPALSLHGDLLAREPRSGLIRATPADAQSLLITGEPHAGAPVVNAARALRRAALLEADWAPELPGAADIGRRAPASWVRINPARPVPPRAPPHGAVFTAPPDPAARPVIAAASALYATSPGLVAQLRKLAAPGQPLSLWRPALSTRLWQGFKPGAGLNTRPRVLWVDEGTAPPWFTDVINETLELAAWIIVERPGSKYAGAVARIPAQDSEYAWSQALAELGPQIMVRPAGTEIWADHYPLLLGAAAGCRLLLDDRMDAPDSFAALRLPARAAAWVAALKEAVADLTGTLALGARTRAAALALPSLEDAPPPWAMPAPAVQAASAAE